MKNIDNNVKTSEILLIFFFKEKGKYHIVGGM
jgi:hypothetical protein